jgi:2-iminobutanoate/2-iminopropanoate deaminase
MTRIRVVALLGSLTLVAVLCGASPPSRKYLPAARTDAAAPPPFSEGVLVGNTLYLAGHIGRDPKTGKTPEASADEARLVLDQFQSTLKQANMSMDDLVYVQVFCSDVAEYNTFNGLYRGYFKGELPARAFIGSGKLLFGARYEVQGIAIKR